MLLPFRFPEGGWEGEVHRTHIIFITLQPIHLVCIDDRTSNLYVLAGSTENLEF
ncbi:DUF6888 family protein [Nostoc sp.]|uniref:DUF6888 family protein n=1 Tax=Nostoc sp. TaxID=1180 RepID=UPI003FA55954